MRRARTLLTVHDLAFLLRPESAQDGLRFYLEQVVPRSIARADYVLTDSENTRNDVIWIDPGLYWERIAYWFRSRGIDPHPYRRPSSS